MTTLELYQEYEEAQSKFEDLGEQLFEIAIDYVDAYNRSSGKKRLEVHQTTGSEVSYYDGKFHFSWDEFYTGYDLHDYSSFEISYERLEEFRNDPECIKKHIEEDIREEEEKRRKNEEQKRKRKEAEYERLKKELGK